MKLVTDSDINQLVIEALDYNASIIALCTGYFGNVTSKTNSEKFKDEFNRLSSASEKRRRQILGVSDE